MKFNRYLKPEIKELLETQYKEYIKETQMTKKEQCALREWVKDGHSVYENTRDAWADGGTPVEFLTVYRDEEYIRQHTKEMSPDEAKKFAVAYYGWSTDADDIVATTYPSISKDSEELPF